MQPNRYTDEELLEALVDWVHENGRLPSTDDINNDEQLPSAGPYYRRFDGIRDATAQAIVWASGGTVEVLQRGDTETTDVSYDEELIVCSDTMVVTIRGQGAPDGQSPD